MNRSIGYGVIDLMIDIKGRLKRNDNSVNSLEILKVAYRHLESFEQVAKTSVSSDLRDLISRHVRRLNDMVSEINDSDSEVDVILQKLKVEIDSFTPQLKTMEHKCSDGLYNTTFPDEDEDEDENEDEGAAAVSSETLSMIGVCDVYQRVKDRLMSSEQQMLMSAQHITSLVGMPGIGKTTLANKIFNDPSIVEAFDHRVWVRLGKKYQAKHIPRRLLQEIDPAALQMLPLQGDGDDEEAVADYLNACFKSKSYLIVLDDVWDRFTIHQLHPLYDNSLLDWKCRCRILLTGRLQQLKRHTSAGALKETIIMRLLNRQESWDLLSHKVFSQGSSSCPPQLVKPGKKIAENCEGLPLTILAVARTLSQHKDNPEYWDQVSKNENHQIFMDAYDEISKVLVPSYTYLPPILKMCFMFIGLFPRKYKVPRSKLFPLWLADGFFELNVHINSYKKANKFLMELVFNSVVMVYQESSFNPRHKIKTCGLHSSFWHLSKKKARETKFALVLSSRNDALEGDGIDGHHRLSFNTNVLFALKDVHKSVEDNCASSARSLLCFAPYLQYQVPLCFRLKLLKELDALSIRFYEFPMEVLQLVRLCYLALTTNGTIPSSISQLQCLEYLIVDQHQNIKFRKDASYLPVEIWSLQKLKHLQVMGSDLPDPPRGASLQSLLTLSDVSARSCTKKVILEGIPCLENLKIRIELAPDDDDGKQLMDFNTHYIRYLHVLRSLKCVVVNPEVVPPVAPFFSKFPETSRLLTHLSLSGLGYPWKEMKIISSLSYLEVLKLKNYAFQGPVWDQEEEGFPFLRSLVIEDTDLVYWKIGAGAFYNLQHLKIKHCYKLKKIDGKLSYYFKRIEVVDCNPSCVKEMKKGINKYSECAIEVHSSWEEKSGGDK